MTSSISPTRIARAIAIVLLTAGAASTAMAQGAEGSGIGLAAPKAPAAKGMTGAAVADRGFAMQAAKGGMGEVALGQMAQQKVASDAVKQFASHMVDDHTKANDELKQIADSKGIALPAAAEPDATSRRLQTLSGAAFDRQYMAAMLADHKKTITLFEKESKTGRDSDLKAFATKTLPTLNMHLQMVQETQVSLGK